MPELTSTTLDDPAEPRGPRICFHPGDAWLASAPAAKPGRPVSPCFHPADDEPAAELPGSTGSKCFHPADAEPTGTLPGSTGSGCFHPTEDDLAAELHRSLTEIDQRALAALAGR